MLFYLPRVRFPGGPSEVVERFDPVDRFSIMPVVILEAVADDLPGHGGGGVQAGGSHPAGLPIMPMVIDALLSSRGFY